MTITCPKCKTRLTLPDEKLKPEGTRFKCSKCQATLFYKGKGRVPQENIGEPEPSSPTPPGFETQISPPTDVSNIEIQHTHATSPPTEQEDSAKVMPSGATAWSPKKDEEPEMQKHAESARETASQIPSSVAAPGKVGPRKTVLVAAAAGVLILGLITIFFFNSQDRATRDMKHFPSAEKGSATPPPSSQVKESLPKADSPAGMPVEPHQGANISEGLPSAMTEEKAVEIVKRSDALFARTSVDSIVRKWTEENAAKFKIVGWQAKKMDEQKYLVSYTALDGDVPKGFYFELDVQSGSVKDLARNPELQKKYNIQ